MKKIIGFGVLFSLIGVTAFGATQIIKQYGTWDNIAQIQMSDSDVRIYKIDDSSDPNVKCYVAYHDFTQAKNMMGNQTSISCVKVK